MPNRHHTAVAVEVPLPHLLVLSHQLFEWQARGAVCEIVSLDVIAGGDVAYVYALLR